MATTTWCLQCGATNRPELAIGVDEDGEPACALHCVKASVPKTVTQPETSEAMIPETMKPCPGALGRPCPKNKKIGPRAKLCTACYAWWHYQTKYAKKKPGKTNGHASEQPRKKSDGGARILAAPHVPVPLDLLANLALLKQDLRTKIEAVELVEALCRLQQLREATVTEASK